MKRILSGSYHRLKRWLTLSSTPVDRPAKDVHRDLLSALLPPQDTVRVDKDYWEKRGSSEQSDRDVVWGDPTFETAEAKHVSYLWGLSQNKDVLDVGAGWGRMGVKLQGSYRSYTGLEQSSSMIARGESRKLNLVQGSGVKMPFPDESFDVVFMVICMSSVHRKVFEIYEESMRCLRPNGVFVIIEPSATAILEKLA